MRKRAGEKFAEASADISGEGARFLQLTPEVVRTVCQTEGFKLRWTARCILADEYEVAQVRHQHQPVAVPIAADLSALCREPGIVIGGLYLNNTALWGLALARSALLHLSGRVQAEVRMAGTLVGKLTDAEHLRLERRTDGIEQIGERPIARPFGGRAARGAHFCEVCTVGLDRCRQFRVRSRHRPRCR